MPRYRYYCENCKVEQMIFHTMKEKITACPLCKLPNQIKKMLTTPNIVVGGENPELAVGELTKEYIETNRDILKQQQQEAKKENYEPS